MTSHQNRSLWLSAVCITAIGVGCVSEGEAIIITEEGSGGAGPGGATSTSSSTSSATSGSGGAAVVQTAHHIAAIGSFGPCTPAVEVAEITEPGTLGGWQAQSAYPDSIGASGVVTHDGCVYSLGGWQCETTNIVNSGYAAAVGDELGPWNSVPSLPFPTFTNRVIANGGYLLSLGGFGTPQVYRAPIDADACTLQSWETHSNMPNPDGFSAIIGAAGYVYSIGGTPPGEWRGVTDVYYAPISDGAIGAWSPGIDLPEGRYGHAAISDGSHVYVIGGTAEYTPQGATPSSDIFAAAIGNDGALGAWNMVGSLPRGRWNVDAGYADGYLYVIGGNGRTDAGDGGTTTAWSAPIDSGTVGSFTEQPRLAEGREANRVAIW